MQKQERSGSSSQRVSCDLPLAGRFDWDNAEKVGCGLIWDEEGSANNKE